MLPNLGCFFETHDIMTPHTSITGDSRIGWAPYEPCMYYVTYVVVGHRQPLQKYSPQHIRENLGIFRPCIGGRTLLYQSYHGPKL